MECMGCGGGRSHPIGLGCMAGACAAAPARSERRGCWWPYGSISMLNPERMAAGAPWVAWRRWPCLALIYIDPRTGGNE